MSGFPELPPLDSPLTFDGANGLVFRTGEGAAGPTRIPEPERVEEDTAGIVRAAALRRRMGDGADPGDADSDVARICRERAILYRGEARADDGDADEDVANAIRALRIRRCRAGTTPADDGHDETVEMIVRERKLMKGAADGLSCSRDDLHDEDVASSIKAMAALSRLRGLSDPNPDGR